MQNVLPPSWDKVMLPTYGWEPSTPFSPKFYGLRPSISKYTSNFTIYDSQDSKNLIKSIVKDLKLDDKVYKPNDVLGRISMAKNNLVVAQAYAQSAKITSADQAAKNP